MAGFVASQLCPQLIFVPCDFKLYIEASRSIMDILRQYGETSPASLDEACKFKRRTHFRWLIRIENRHLSDGLLQARESHTGRSR